MTFARFATVAVPLPPRDPASPSSARPASPGAWPPVVDQPARLGAVSGREMALLPVYDPADRSTAVLPACADDAGETAR